MVVQNLRPVPPETKALQGLFLDLVARSRPEVVLELGCYRADFSIACRRFLPEAEIHAFEANPILYANKAHKIEREGVRCHHMAIGDHVGPAEFLIRTRQGGKIISPKKGSNSLRRRAHEAEYEVLAVQMTTVDHFARETGLLGQRAIMWIDLEGCAYEALTGASEMLATTEALMVEVEDEPCWEGQRLIADVERLLAGAGFQPIARDHEFVHQYNVIFVR